MLKQTRWAIHQKATANTHPHKAVQILECQQSTKQSRSQTSQIRSRQGAQTDAQGPDHTNSFSTVVDHTDAGGWLHVGRAATCRRADRRVLRLPTQGGVQQPAQQLDPCCTAPNPTHSRSDWDSALLCKNHGRPGDMSQELRETARAQRQDDGALRGGHLPLGKHISSCMFWCCLMRSSSVNAVSGMAMHITYMCSSVSSWLLIKQAQQGAYYPLHCIGGCLLG